MGYEISVDRSEIHIKKENFGSVLNAIASIPHRMAWTELKDIQRIAKSGDITEMFDHLGWPVEFDSDGNIVRMEFDSSKMGDEEVWLGAIAPYVGSGCIQVRGEDGDLWRWILSGGKLKEIRPEIKWPERKMSPEELAAYREWIRISKFASNSWPCMALDHIDQQAAQIAELDDAVSGPLENITKMLETVNADTILAGVIQTWKNENQTLKSQIAALKEIAIKEKASGLFNGPWDSGLPDDCGYDAEIEACRTEARRRLVEKHPEAVR